MKTFYQRQNERFEVKKFCQSKVHKIISPQLKFNAKTINIDNEIEMFFSLGTKVEQQRKLLYIDRTKGKGIIRLFLKYKIREYVQYLEFIKIYEDQRFQISKYSQTSFRQAKQSLYTFMLKYKRDAYLSLQNEVEKKNFQDNIQKAQSIRQLAFKLPKNEKMDALMKNMIQSNLKSQISNCDDDKKSSSSEHCYFQISPLKSRDSFLKNKFKFKEQVVEIEETLIISILPPKSQRFGQKKTLKKNDKGQKPLLPKKEFNTDNEQFD